MSKIIKNHKYFINIALFQILNWLSVQNLFRNTPRVMLDRNRKPKNIFLKLKTIKSMEFLKIEKSY